MDKLDRLLSRLPPHLERTVRLCSLDGLSQTQVAHATGVSQPAVCWRLQDATRRLRVLGAMPDLSPEQVHRIVLQAGEPQKIAVLAAHYWEHWAMPPRSRNSYYLLFGYREKYRAGMAYRHRESAGMIGEVARGLLTIRGARQHRALVNHGALG